MLAMRRRRMHGLLHHLEAPSKGGVFEVLRELVRDGRIDAATLHPGRALVLGAGTGSDAIFLADHGFDVVAVDSSKIALDKAEMEAKGRPDRRLGFARAHVEDGIPFPDGSFDLVADDGTIAEVGRVRRPGAARELARLVRPGGIVILRGRRRSRGTLRGGISPGTAATLFSATFDVASVPSPGGEVFLLTRRGFD